LIKVSKDSECSLVSSKNLSEILPSSGLSPQPGEVGQGGLKVLHLWRHSQKTRNPQPKIFFNADAKTCRIFWRFEQLSRTIVGGDIPTQKHVQAAGF